MEIKRIYQIYFSPAGTTRKVTEAAAAGALNLASETAAGSLESLIYDFTLPRQREAFPELSSSDLVFFAMPTYAGRLPNLLLPYLNSTRGCGAVAAAVVTFGNRNFDNSLLELSEILEKNGFNLTAGGAFSCQHSFSDTLAAGRPDMEDLAEAFRFGQQTLKKVLSIDSASGCDKPFIDGDLNQGYYQPRDRKGTFIDFRKVTPVTASSCTGCGTCAANCPMGAISEEDFSLITGKCIKCNSCVKKCPAGAKHFDDPGYLYHKDELEAMYGTRRAQNKIFI